MEFCFSSKDKWKNKKSCFEYCTFFFDNDSRVDIVVMDSDLNEFRNEFKNELENGRFVEKG